MDWTKQPGVMDRVQRLSQHEIGHWLMAERQGFLSGDIVLTLTHPAAGHTGHAAVTLLASFSDLSEVDAYVCRRILVLYAGALAESINRVGQIDFQLAVTELRSGGSTNDHKGIRELMRVLRGLRFPVPGSDDEHHSQLQALEDELWPAAVDFININSDLIRGLGGNLASRFHSIGVSFGITAAELNALPAVKEWRTTWSENISASTPPS